MTIEPILIFTALIVSLLFGAIISYVFSRSRQSTMEQAIASLSERVVNREQQLSENKLELESLKKLEDLHEESLAKLREENSTLKERVRNDEQRISEFQALQERFSETFKALSSDALKSNNMSFLELASQSLQKYQEGARTDLEKRQLAIDLLVKPIQDNLERVDKSIGELEKNRLSSFAALDQHLKSLTSTQHSLIDQTSNLVKALRTPNTRGRWGEIQLKRVVEMSGMIEHCDFYQQESFAEDEKRFRPDMTIRLAGGKSIVVDSKAPLQAYLEAIEAKDENTKSVALANHARQIRSHITQLGQKKYWDKLEQSPEFVILFLPGENFFSAALEVDPQLIEYGVEQKVIVATPTTLIALLRAISYGWRQEQLEKNAREISALGKELYERLMTFSQHFGDIKKGLEKSVESYNKAVSSLESRVMVSARRFKELDAGNQAQLPEIEAIESLPRTLQIASANGE
jgi:DNA recombination protein RmuC